MATEWVSRLRKEGAGAVLDQLGIETDDDFQELDTKEAARLSVTLKPVQQRRFLRIYGSDEPSPSELRRLSLEPPVTGSPVKGQTDKTDSCKGSLSCSIGTVVGSLGGSSK